MKETWYKTILWFIKKMFVGLSIFTIGSLVPALASNCKERIKCIFLNNQW